jgi:hypothetical protein
MNFNYNGATEAQRILLCGVGINVDQDGISQETCIAVSAILGISKAATARFIRQAALTATDWMALSDVTMSPAWAAYRQELRDITKQAGFPDNIVWPKEPVA